MVKRVLFVIQNMRKGDKDYSLPLGPAYLAAVLERDGIEVELLDLDVLTKGEEIGEDEIVNMIVAKAPLNYVGIGFASARYNMLKPTLKAIRRACDELGAFMILGGHAPSATPFFMRDNTGADIVVCGEAENIISYIVSTDRFGLVEYPSPPYNLDELPLPAFHLFDMDTYGTPSAGIHMFNENEKMAYVTSSRGCIGKCSFCYRMHKGYRTRDIEEVRKEIEMLKELYKVRYIFLQDEMAFSGKLRTKKLCKAMYSTGLKWATSCRAEALQNIDRVKMIKDSGCTFIGVGFESMDSEVLKRMGKMITPEQNRKAASNCKKVGLDMGVNILWAMPGDTVESLEKNIQFIIDYSTWNECRTIKPVTPYPGSPLYHLAMEEGKLKGPGDFYDSFTNLDLITVNFTDLPIEKMYELLYEANAKLIDVYCRNVAHKLQYGDADEMKRMYYDLYFNNDVSFRGVR